MSDNRRRRTDWLVSDWAVDTFADRPSRAFAGWSFGAFADWSVGADWSFGAFSGSLTGVVAEWFVGVVRLLSGDVTPVVLFADPSKIKIKIQFLNEKRQFK